MFQILSYGTTKSEGSSQISEHTFKVLCTSENISRRAWIRFKTLIQGTNFLKKLTLDVKLAEPKSGRKSTSGIGLLTFSNIFDS